MEDVLHPVTTWLNENWLLLSLIVSEIAAMLPFKAKGIIHAIWKVAECVFKQGLLQTKNSVK